MWLLLQIRLERSWQGLLVGERGGWSTHHDSGEAHWIFQVGFVVLQVDRTGLEWRVQSHLGGGRHNNRNTSQNNEVQYDITTNCYFKLE